MIRILNRGQGRITHRSCVIVRSQGLARYAAKSVGGRMDRRDRNLARRAMSDRAFAGGNLRRSEIFRPTATSERFVVELPQRNATRAPLREQSISRVFGNRPDASRLEQSAAGGGEEDAISGAHCVDSRTVAASFSRYLFRSSG